MLRDLPRHSRRLLYAKSDATAPRRGQSLPWVILLRDAADDYSGFRSDGWAERPELRASYGASTAVGIPQISRTLLKGPILGHEVVFEGDWVNLALLGADLCRN